MEQYNLTVWNSGEIDFNTHAYGIIHTQISVVLFCVHGEISRRIYANSEDSVLCISKKVMCKSNMHYL